MYLAAIMFLIVSMGMIIIRAWKGPLIFDKILAANMFGTNVVLVIVILGFAKNSPSYIDIALVYAFLNFVGTIAMLRFTRYGSFKAQKKPKDLS